MTAYSFKKRFIAPILAGTKTQTIRAQRKFNKRPPPQTLDEFHRMILGHVRPGGAVQLYTAMRTVSCRKIGDAVCAAVDAVTFTFHPKLFPEIKVKHATGMVEVYQGDDDLNAFAVRDGFQDWPDMMNFWKQEHGANLMTWSGVLISWRDLRPV